MKTIEKIVIDELDIQKSRFITILYPINQKEQIKTLLTQVKQEYPGATHYCYAYIMDQYEHCSDDGEPSKTAGMPMLNVLKMENLDHVLAIVIRYFGGIKLGASGLVRAYTNAVSKSIKKASLICLTRGYLLTISFPYQQTKEINYLIHSYNIIKKEYHEDILYQIEIPITDIEMILKQLDSLSATIIHKEEQWIKMQS